ncbi:hypothetical protein L2E82_10575 [Cichorium intybus]|uniref:Uncharacterized protein n=1 Tax=Cichorium intybus TaxID=13427 RepID=A0ACB9GBJ4_CICIN|nr:hypothetical protein L2E82_10575 [Cichorium intybus]
MGWGVAKVRGGDSSSGEGGRVRAKTMAEVRCNDSSSGEADELKFADNVLDSSSFSQHLLHSSSVAWVTFANMPMETKKKFFFKKKKTPFSSFFMNGIDLSPLPHEST